jgi:GNAT superfamily N-acetyltransferase
VGAVTVVVRRAAVAETIPLRHAVLRPGRPASASAYPEDDAAVHLGAWDAAVLVGCATVFPDPWPGSDLVGPEPAAWRLRGMAVDPTRQRRGVGREVLAAAVAAARDAGAPLLWANARTTALGFYEKQGWRVAGAEYVTEDTGLPHEPIVLDLT